jgi:large-conductance mechanosensitive channel
MAVTQDEDSKALDMNTLRALGGRHREKVVAMAKGVKPVSGFVDFLREHAIVGLAIGFVVGTQVQAVVKQLISSFINPLFLLVFPGNQTLSDRTFTLHLYGRAANFGWGAVAFTVMDFVAIVFTIYVIIKLFKLDKLDKPK